jgi:mannose-6-phosphate isomerase-like protein (cupin superfamily)
MTASLTAELRARRLVSLTQPASLDASGAVDASGIATRYARLQHTLVAWSEFGGPGTLRNDAEHEVIVVFPDAAAVVDANGNRTDAPARSIAVLPAGASTIELGGRGTVVRFFTPVGAGTAAPVNGDDYALPRPRLRAVGTPFARIGSPAPRVHPIERLPAPKTGVPRCVQSETMSVMWIDHAGPQDRSKVQPHAHADFEEGTLVLEGRYVQHLRTPWGTNVDLWRDDDHLGCERGALVIVPAEVVHSAEAIGEGSHVLLNFFAPVRRDHIEKGQVINAAEYRAPQG